jgi:hypothetical protein
VPFKHHADQRHHIPKPRYRVTNWPEYDAALRRRGSLTIWFTDEAIAARAGEILDKITDPIASFTADGAYDQNRVYQAIAERHPDAAVIVPPRSSAALSASAGTAPTRRDQHIREIAGHGRMGWRKSSGYNVRAKVEAAIGRYKRVIGDALRSRTDETEATEVAIAARVLNQYWGLDVRTMSGSCEQLIGAVPLLDPANPSYSSHSRDSRTGME